MAPNVDWENYSLTLYDSCKSSCVSASVPFIKNKQIDIEQ